MQLYAKFSAIFHGKAIQATAAKAETERERGPRRHRRGEKTMTTTVILIVLLTRLIHKQQRGRDEDEAETLGGWSNTGKTKAVKRPHGTNDKGHAWLLSDVTDFFIKVNCQSDQKLFSWLQNQQLHANSSLCR